MKSLECNYYNNQDVYSDGLPLLILEDLKRPSNQIMHKNADGSLDGVRYIVATQPSQLRPIKSWTITIETWFCSPMADITIADSLHIRIVNAPNMKDSVVQEILVRNEKIDLEKMAVFNAVMAAGTIINKIDAGRYPDTEKIMATHNL